MDLEEAKRLSLCGYGCNVVGGPFISENPKCPECRDPEPEPFDLTLDELLANHRDEGNGEPLDGAVYPFVFLSLLEAVARLQPDTPVGAAGEHVEPWATTLAS